jgi:hypothetical protein
VRFLFDENLSVAVAIWAETTTGPSRCSHHRMRLADTPRSVDFHQERVRIKRIKRKKPPFFRLFRLIRSISALPIDDRERNGIFEHLGQGSIDLTN